MPSEQSNCFVDTNILLYLRDMRTPGKQATALRWIDALQQRKALVISPQVINEFCNVTLTKFQHIPRAEIAEAVSAFNEWCTAETSVATALAALDLQTEMHVRFYDAVLLASALAAQCAFFLSEDLQHERQVRDMRIVNPFLAAPDAVLANRT